MTAAGRSRLWLPLVLLLAACDQGLHFSIRFDQAGGLQVGDPLIQEATEIGRVTAIGPPSASGQWVRVVVERQFAVAATVDSLFYIDDDPDQPDRKSVVIEQVRPGGKTLEDGAEVVGADREERGLLPFRRLFREFGGILQQLRDEVERFRQQFEQLPDTPEVRELRQQWLRLLEELGAAQNSAEGSIRKELIPRLQEQMDAIRRRLEELRPAPPRPRQEPLET
jgi:hypothetical protein